MKKAIVICLLGTLIVSITSCDKKELLGEILLSPEVKKTLPFSGNESLYYVNEDDTVMMECKYRRSELIHANPSINTNDYYVLERSYIGFAGIDLSLNLSIVTEISYDAPLLIITFIDDTDEIKGCSEGWWLPLNEKTFKENQWKEDSIVVQGITYYNVYCDSSTCSYSSDYLNLFLSYYTKEFGLIKYEYEDGSAWELLKIDWNEKIAP